MSGDPLQKRVAFCLSGISESCWLLSLLEVNFTIDPQMSLALGAFL